MPELAFVSFELWSVDFGLVGQYHVRLASMRPGVLLYFFFSAYNTTAPRVRKPAPRAQTSRFTRLQSMEMISKTY